MRTELVEIVCEAKSSVSEDRYEGESQNDV